MWSEERGGQHSGKHQNIPEANRRKLKLGKKESTKAKGEDPKKRDRIAKEEESLENKGEVHRVK